MQDFEHIVHIKTGGRDGCNPLKGIGCLSYTIHQSFGFPDMVQEEGQSTRLAQLAALDHFVNKDTKFYYISQGLATEICYSKVLKMCQNLHTNIEGFCRANHNFTS